MQKPNLKLSEIAIHPGSFCGFLQFSPCLRILASDHHPPDGLLVPEDGNLFHPSVDYYSSPS